MKSAKCAECGFVGWADAELCKRCGAAMPSPAAEGSYQPRPAYSQNSPPRYESQAEPRKGLAVASLVVGIVSCFTFAGLLGIGAVIGVILGIVAMVKANRYPSEYAGKGLATAGMITSVCSFVILVPIGLVMAIAIPNLLASARAANEGSAQSSLKSIYNAESTYHEVHGTYGTMDQLIKDRLLDAELSTGRRRGYRFAVDGHAAPEGFEATAVPAAYPTTGIRSFYIDENGVIRAGDRHGGEATRLDPELGSDYPEPNPRRSTVRVAPVRSPR